MRVKSQSNSPSIHHILLSASPFSSLRSTSLPSEIGSQYPSFRNSRACAPPSRAPRSPCHRGHWSHVTAVLPGLAAPGAGCWLGEEDEAAEAAVSTIQGLIRGLESSSVGHHPEEDRHRSPRKHDSQFQEGRGARFRDGVRGFRRMSGARGGGLGLHEGDEGGSAMACWERRRGWWQS
jgi:hypothetical protein